MGKKVRVQMIGSFLDNLIKYFDKLDIISESIIQSCNPLAMSGKKDKSYFDLCNDINMPMSGLLNIRKNLDQMLSRDSDNFCQNYNLQPLAKEMRVKNTSEYLIFMNSSSEIPLFEKNGMVYSDCSPSNGITAAVSKDQRYTKRNFPFSGDFNWKYYFDNFIAAIKKEYDSDHIILIRTNCSNWYMDNKDIKAFGPQTAAFRDLIAQMDEYFIEQTNCLIVDDLYRFITPSYIKCWFPYIRISQYAWETIAYKIKEIVTCENKEIYRASFPRTGCSLVRNMLLRFNDTAIEKNRKFISEIEEKWLDINDIKRVGAAAGTFYADILSLEHFIGNDYTLSDYVYELGENAPDLDLVERYTEYFKADINDIIAVYLLFERSENRDRFNIIINNIMSSGSIAVKVSEELENKNVKTLIDYPYINSRFAGRNEGNSIYIRLENNSWLELNSRADVPIRKIDDLIKQQIDVDRIISDGCVCRVDCADALTYSCEYYIEKARRGLGKKPTVIVFDSVNEFYESLRYIDYTELLQNEPFIFSISGIKPENCESCVPLVDLTTVIDPKTVHIRIGAGLGDQINYYVEGRIIEQFTNRKVIFDDSWVVMGPKIKELFDINATMLSEILSERLFGYIQQSKNSFISFFTKIDADFVYVALTEADYKKYSGNGNSVFLAKNIKSAVNTKIPYSFHQYLAPLDELKSHFDYNLKDYFEFPPFEKDYHIRLSNELLSCDSVVIHIRLGDYVSVGWNIDNEFYIEAIKRVMGLNQYKNKKFFIFSDDLQYCKEHKDKFGLDLIGDCEIYFVEGNNEADSYRDVQLMALGKIMIIGYSQFSNLAAVYSDKWEMIFCAGKRRSDLLQNYVRRNKYETEPFAKDYKPDRSKMKPKALQK